jgi:Cu2+-exporting ATPase
MRPRLGSILTVLDLSRKAVRRVKFNFGWSFVYNLFAILLGAGVFAHLGGAGGEGVRIPPQFAGLGELVSVLPVVAAAVALRWERI